MITATEQVMGWTFRPLQKVQNCCQAKLYFCLVFVVMGWSRKSKLSWFRTTLSSDAIIGCPWCELPLMGSYWIPLVLWILGNWGIDGRLETTEWAEPTSCTDEATTEPVSKPGRWELPLSAAPPLLAAQLGLGGPVETAKLQDPKSNWDNSGLEQTRHHSPQQTFKVCLRSNRVNQQRLGPSD